MRRMPSGALLPTATTVRACRQLRDTADALRVLQTLVKLWPIRHSAERRAASYVLLCVLA